LESQQPVPNIGVVPRTAASSCPLVFAIRYAQDATKSDLSAGVYCFPNSCDTRIAAFGARNASAGMAKSNFKFATPICSFNLGSRCRMNAEIEMKAAFDAYTCVHRPGAHLKCFPRVWLGRRPAKSHENTSSRMHNRTGLSGEIEFAMEKLRSSTCLIRSVRD